MKLKFAATVLMVTSAPVGCLAEQVPFYGILQYTHAENCAQQTAGSRYKSLYMPSNLGDNDPNYTTINETFDFGGHAYKVAGRFTSSFRVVEAHSASFGAHQYEARIRIITSVPPDESLTRNTNFISLTGQIEHPQGDPGVGEEECVMSFRASYTRLNKEF